MPFGRITNAISHGWSTLRLLDVAINGFLKLIVSGEDIYPLVVILKLPEQIAFTQLVINPCTLCVCNTYVYLACRLLHSR